jgi:hypothetical protein
MPTEKAAIAYAEIDVGASAPHGGKLQPAFSAQL